MSCKLLLVNIPGLPLPFNFTSRTPPTALPVVKGKGLDGSLYWKAGQGTVLATEGFIKLNWVRPSTFTITITRVSCLSYTTPLYLVPLVLLPLLEPG